MFLTLDSENMEEADRYECKQFIEGRNTFRESAEIDSHCENSEKSVARRTFEEKLQAEFLPFLLVEKVPIIGKKFFQRNSFSNKFYTGALRRFCFLMSTGGEGRACSSANCPTSAILSKMTKVSINVTF